MSNHTLYELATDWDLFCEFADTGATWTEEEFDRIPAAEKLRQLIDAFGMADEGRNELAANDRDGVYPCENGTREVLTDMAFYEALASATDTIYGSVSDSVAALIEDEYGIH